MIITCSRCNEAQTTLEVAINKARPEACGLCGNTTFQITAKDALAIDLMEKQNHALRMLIDGAYS